MGLVMGQIPVGQLYVLQDACRGCTQCWTLQAGFPPTSDLWDMLILPSPEIPADASSAFGPSLPRGGTREPSRSPGGDSDSGLVTHLKNKNIWKKRNSVHWSYFGNLEWPPQQENQLVLGLWFRKMLPLNVCVIPDAYSLLWHWTRMETPAHST